MLLRIPGSLILGAFALSAALAQDQPPPAPTPVPPPATAAMASPDAKPLNDPKAKPTVPDYPDPRTFTIGLFYWFTVPGTGPDIHKGKLGSTGAEDLPGLGKAHQSPGFEASVPITRTGALYLEGFRNVGSGNQKTPFDTFVFGSDFTKGDLLATSYRVDSVRIYLDDLFWPHKFPVAKFRVKSILGGQYVGFKGSVDDLNSTTSIGSASRTIILPIIGAAAEYAIAPHVLLRTSISGFGLPHRSAVGDGDATISIRQHKLEFVGGFKGVYYKSSPKKEQFITQELYGAFVGIRYHFGS